MSIFSFSFLSFIQCLLNRCLYFYVSFRIFILSVYLSFCRLTFMFFCVPSFVSSHSPSPLIFILSRRKVIWVHSLNTSGFWPRVRARVLRAPVFFRLINMQNGALRAPPPIAASLLLIYTPKLSLRPELGQSGVRIS